MPHPTLIYPQNRRASRATASSRPHLRRHPRPSPFAHILPSKTAHDGNGNVRALVKADAANPAVSGVVERYAYDGFGRELPSSTIANRLSPFAFSTKYLEPETGMNYYGYRYYSADAGRWINRDSILEKGGWNVYGVLGNDALNRWDFLGQSDKVVLYLVTLTGNCRQSTDSSCWDPHACEGRGAPKIKCPNTNTNSSTGYSRYKSLAYRMALDDLKRLCNSDNCCEYDVGSTVQKESKQESVDAGDARLGPEQ